jgi:hypothetical protein
MDNQSPFFVGGDLFQKPSSFRANIFYCHFLQAVVEGPILGIDFLRKFRIIVAPETSQILFACTATALAAKPFLPNFVQISELPFLFCWQLSPLQCSPFLILCRQT